MRTTDLAGMGKRAPQKTWFFKRGDGMIFAAEAREAWDIINNRGNWRRHDFKLLGCSDGKTYERVVREKRAEADALQPELVRMRTQLERYRKAEERLMVDEAVDEDDLTDPVNAENVAKLKRLQGLIERFEKKLAKKEKEYRDLTKNVTQQAFDAELKVARKNPIEYPPAMNIITPGATPRRRKRVLDLLEGAAE